MVTNQDIQHLNKRLRVLESKVEYLYKHLGVIYIPEPGPADDPRIIELVKQGKKLEAIKLYREITNENMADAQQELDDLQRRLGI